MKLNKEFRTSCCNKVYVSEDEYDLIEKLFVHIRNNHPKLYKRIKVLGEKHARSQIGNGYGGDFEKAQTSFQNAWMKKALKYMLQHEKS